MLYTKNLRINIFLKNKSFFFFFLPKINYWFIIVRHLSNHIWYNPNSFYFLFSIFIIYIKIALKNYHHINVINTYIFFFIQHNIFENFELNLKKIKTFCQFINSNNSFDIACVCVHDMWFVAFVYIYINIFFTTRKKKHICSSKC